MLVIIIITTTTTVWLELLVNLNFIFQCVRKV